ncbi:hypothetical protein BH11PLA1_BH11PLA1_17120 [soil metagenome]
MPDEASTSARVKAFPFVSVNVARREVWIEGEVAVDAHDPETPAIYLETVVCAVDTKDYESLVVTRARPSHVHAALLLCGLEPGAPGRMSRDAAGAMAHVAPRGPEVEVEIRWSGGTAQARQWILGASARVPRPVIPNGLEAAPARPERGFVFAGSAFRRVSAARDERGGAPDAAFIERYRADDEGTIVGLSTFGTEVVAYADVLWHESRVDAPVWIADPARLPVRGTPVTVILRAK